MVNEAVAVARGCQSTRALSTAATAAEHTGGEVRLYSCDDFVAVNDVKQNSTFSAVVQIFLRCDREMHTFIKCNIIVLVPF